MPKWFYWFMLGLDYGTIATSIWATLMWLDKNSISFDLKIMSVTNLIFIVTWTVGIIYARNREEHNDALVLNVFRFIFILLNTIGIDYLRKGF